VIFDHLGHEAIYGAAGRDDQVQNGSAALLARNSALERFDLTAHAPNSLQELRLLGDRM
jgi:hypothetical protein